MFYHYKKVFRSVAVALGMLLSGTYSTAQYCQPMYNIGCGGLPTTFDINDFILVASGNSSIYDTSTGCVGGYYHDNRTARFTPVDLIQGRSYSGLVSSHGNRADTTSIKIWIDFNNDATFQTSEEVTTIRPWNRFQHLYKYPYTISIPPTADTGVHRMRVRLDISKTIDPCTFQTYGESHDYRVRIVKPAANDIGVYKIADMMQISYKQIDSTFCTGRIIPVRAIVKNYGDNTQTSFNVQLDYSGPTSGTLQATYTGTLLAQAQDTVLIPFTATAAGEYTLTAYTILQTDIFPNNDPASKKIIVDSMPQALLIDTGICALAFPIVLDAGNVNCTYVWNTFSDKQYIQAFGPGKYNVAITSRLGCFVTDTATITSFPLPTVAGIGIRGSGREFIFNAGAPENVDQFYWDFGDGDTGITDTVAHTYNADGNYKIRLVIYNKCGTDTATFDIMIVTSGMKGIELKDKDILIYPNPAHDFVYVQSPTDLNINQLLIMDGKGRTVRELNNTNTASKNTVELNGLVAGNYILVIRSDKGNYYRMLCIGG